VLQENIASRLSRVDAHAICADKAARIAQQLCGVCLGAVIDDEGKWCCRRLMLGEGKDITAIRIKSRAASPLVMIALVASFCLNSSAAYLITAVNGAFSGTFMLRGFSKNTQLVQCIDSCLADAKPGHQILDINLSDEERQSSAHASEAQSAKA